MMFFAATAPAFFIRERPISRAANPVCISSTKQPAAMTQTVSMATAFIRGFPPGKGSVPPRRGCAKVSLRITPSHGPLHNGLEIRMCTWINPHAGRAMESSSRSGIPDIERGVRTCG